MCTSISQFGKFESEGVYVSAECGDCRLIQITTKAAAMHP
jgi:hypothetical protein